MTEPSLDQLVLLGDGGYLIELERRGYVRAGGFTPEVVLEFPEALASLHHEFRRAGADILEALTFYADELTLATCGHERDVHAINVEAVRIARRCAGGLLVAGVITQTRGFSSGQEALRRTRGLMEAQVAAQAEGGVDFILAETFIRLDEALVALEVARGSGKPVVVTLTAGMAGTRDGRSLAEAARALEQGGATMIGCNCTYGPAESLAIVAELKRHTSLPLACQPVGYETRREPAGFTRLPEFPLALERYQLDRFVMAEFAERAQALGVRLIGGCCGVAPYHIRAMAAALGRRDALDKTPRLTDHSLDWIRERARPGYWTSRIREASRQENDGDPSLSR